MGDESVLVERSGPKLTITLNRPEAINALNEAVFAGINAALDEAEKDDDVRVVLLRGAGPRGFCPGLDLKDVSRLRDQAGGALSGARSLVVQLYGTAKRIDEFPKPVISLIHGHVVAGGCQLATAADLVIASDNLRMQEVELQRGMWFDHSYLKRLTRLLGPAKTKAFVLMSEPLSAQQAFELGLVSLVVPNDELQAAGERLADKVASYSPSAISLTLSVIDKAAVSGE